MYCIYKVKNNINGKTYIGQHYYGNNFNPLGFATNKKGHYHGSGKILLLAYKKYGIKNFSIEVLYQRILTQETADSMEIYAIKKERNLGHAEYNIKLGGQRRTLCGEAFSNRIKDGMKKSGAAEKISESMKGERNPFYGKSAWNKGIPATPEAKEKNRLSHIGLKMSEESKQKRRDFMKAHPNSGMFKKGQVSQNKGKVYYKNPNSMESKLFFEGQQPAGWIRGRWTPWQGK